MRPVLVLVFPLLALAQSQLPVFKSATNLQSIAVQVTDAKGIDVAGLAANDFTLLEDGRPQKIAFFAAERQPVSLAILIDSSSSMEFGGNLDRARALLVPLIRGNHPDDEIFLIPFADRVGMFRQLTAAERVNPPNLKAGSLGGGTALYDALASAQCHLRTAQNLRQAVIVVTDGADQHSRLKLGQLIELARTSTPQIFMIGLFNSWERDIYRVSESTIRLVSGREIDNPITVFSRLGKESGAESFFPDAETDLKRALERISAVLAAQYTLAYYPSNVDKYRRIEVKVNRRGVQVMARRGVGSETGAEPVRFASTTCEVSAQDHPYPWESRVTQGASNTRIYREDFSNPASGWPNRPGSRYKAGGYELSRSLPANFLSGPDADGIIAAYGPPWTNFRASAFVEGDWSRNSPGRYASATGLVFRLSGDGYYALALSAVPSPGIRTSKLAGMEVAFQLVRKSLRGRPQTEIVPWTRIAFDPAKPLVSERFKISVTCNGRQIAISVNEQEVSRIEDDTLEEGFVGFALFGDGRATFSDLMVESLP